MKRAPTPSIYLQNRFTLEKSKNTAFFAGKERLLRSTRDHFRLIAGCGERGLKLSHNLPEPSLRMMHVWELDGWSSVYDTMYELSEAKWYRALGDAVSSEDQHLLVNFTSGYGIEPRRTWRADSDPGYRYFYEEISLIKTATMHGYLRELNWFAAELQQRGIRRIWCARHITGRPGTICVLWSVPEGVDMEALLDDLAEHPRTRVRYARMLGTVRDLTRELLQPMYTERLDERIRAGETAPIVATDSGPRRDPGSKVRHHEGESNGYLHASS